MDDSKKNSGDGGIGRRNFLKTATAAALTAVLTPAHTVNAQPFSTNSLQVWSCGGLAEAFNEANAAFTKKTGVSVSYTGAFAAALGKSLLGGAVTEVFAGRVLKLAQDLRAADKMIYFKPFCFTEYVIVTPKGNPKNIKTLEDLTRPDMKVILPLGASPPGGDAVKGLLKKSGMDKAIMKNMIRKETCVIKMMPQIIAGEGHASIVERRLTCQPKFAGKVDVISIPEDFFPPPPLTFTIGVMKHAKDRQLADAYVNYMCDDEAQATFGRHGFIPAASEKGKILIEKFGVKDA